MQILVNGSPCQSSHIPLLRRLLVRLLVEPRFTLTVQPDFLTYLRRILPDISTCLTEHDGRTPDLILSIGGDGTFLATASIAADSGIPIMGINSGHLGYLAATSISDTDAIVNAIYTRSYLISPRSLIELTTDDPACPPRYALNEVAFLKRTTSSMISVSTTITIPAHGIHPCATMPLADYLGDGVIVATPTGSTGYNLSAGGPIVAPSSPCFVISPIAAHSLTMRSFVLPDTVTLDITASSRAGQYLVSVDGQSERCTPDCRFRLRKAPFVINLVHLPDHNFIDNLRTKLLWGVDGR